MLVSSSGAGWASPMMFLSAGSTGETNRDKGFRRAVGVLIFKILFPLHRDMRLTSIGGGADEVMLGIICKTMGTLPSQKKRKK